MTAMVSSDLPLRRLGRGKVRDIYEVDASRLLLLATDRVSAYVEARSSRNWAPSAAT